MLLCDKCKAEIEPKKRPSMEALFHAIEARKGLCKEKLQGMFVNCYCVLPQGHEGEHQTLKGGING